MAALFPGAVAIATAFVASGPDAMLAALKADEGITDNLARTLRAMYTDAYLAGAYTTSLQKGTTLSADLLSAMDGIDWSSWSPASFTAADLVRGEGLSKLLAEVDVVIQGVAQTELNRIGDALAKGIEQGLSAEEIASSIRPLVGSDNQAMAIATTEVARAQNAAAIDIYRSAGVEKFNWLTDTNPCPLCQAKADKSPYPIDAERPPLHPHCRCETQAVFIKAKVPALAGRTEETA
jgi:SPP1 gp7 family putative phage head morphogenesis protein